MDKRVFRGEIARKNCDLIKKHADEIANEFNKIKRLAGELINSTGGEDDKIKLYDKKTGDLFDSIFAEYQHIVDDWSKLQIAIYNKEEEQDGEL